MDFSWPQEYLDYQNKVIEFARTELQDNLVARDQQGEFSYDLWKKCADFGIQGLAAPAAYGGTQEQVNFLRSVLAMEGLGIGCPDNGLTFGLNAQMWTVQLPILQFGTEQQKEKFLPKFCSGEWIGAHALTETTSGSDVFNMEMTATRDGDSYILNGQKVMVSFGPIADVAMVFASSNPKLGKWGVSAFLVEKDTPGYTQSPVRQKMGLRTIPFGELNFVDCRVPVENRLGAEGAGFSLSNHSLEYERCSILASHLGAMQRQLDETVDFVKKRKRFGQPIGKFQSVSNRVADMKLRLETSRLLLYKSSWLKETGKSAMLEAALLKLHMSECFVDSSLDAIRCQGGTGYMTASETERDARDAIGGLLYAGTSDIQRNIVARLLGI